MRELIKLFVAVLLVELLMSAAFVALEAAYRELDTTHGARLDKVRSITDPSNFDEPQHATEYKEPETTDDTTVINNYITITGDSNDLEVDNEIHTAPRTDQKE